MISVVMVTNRKGAVDVLNAQLKKQTFQDFEVIIADDLCEKDNGKHFKPRSKQEGECWNINKGYNDALSKVKGELVVFVQDFIWLPANGLQRFWDLYKLFPEALITGCGHKAKTVNGDGRPQGISETDDRVFGEKKLVESDWTYYELNWASCPTSMLVKFDEEMDKHYGGENQIFALKATIKNGMV